MIIRKASASDLDAVEKVYNDVHDAEEAGLLTTGWIRGVYPVRKTAEAALERDDLFVLEAGGVIRGAAVINRIQVDVYEGAPWEYSAKDSEVMVLHTLAISPLAAGQGYGKNFIAFYENYAKEQGCTELRIDTNQRNKRAKAMYLSLGYKEITVVPTVFNDIPGVNLVLLEKHI